mgnify:CR=1 FL=1
MNPIGTLHETSLHAAIKQLYARPGDLIEENVDGLIIDIVRENTLIEIQTGNFSPLKYKFERLLEKIPIRVVYPLPLNRTILRIANNGELSSIRKSPKKGKIQDVFYELVRIPRYAIHTNFSLEVLYIEDEVVWCNDGRGSWRRKGWSIQDRRLVRIIGSRIFQGSQDYASMLPDGLGKTFSSVDLIKLMGIRRTLAGKMLYSLREMGIIELAGKQGRFNLYKLAS